MSQTSARNSASWAVLRLLMPMSHVRHHQVMATIQRDIATRVGGLIW
jgi:hypothetical protein